MSRTLNEIKDDIKKYYENPFSYEYPFPRYNAGDFLNFFIMELRNKRSKRKNNIENERKSREEIEIKIRKDFKRTHEKTEENVKKELEDHKLRFETEKKIIKKEDEDEIL